PKPLSPEAVPSEPPVPVVAELPGPRVGEPMLEFGSHGGAPRFENDTGLPFTPDSKQTFPPAEHGEPVEPVDEDQTVYLPPAARAPHPVEVPQRAGGRKTEQDPDALPTVDPNMDMDMEGLSEALKGDSSK
ncbi:MAG: hypothetical protein ACRD1X_03435, partial [Vicinamibacteria bacterium]